MPAPETVEVSDRTPETVRALIDPSLQSVLHDLHEMFGAQCNDLLQARLARQRKIDNGALPEFGSPDRDACAGSNILDTLADRRVEWQTPVKSDAFMATRDSAAATVLASLDDALPVPGDALAAQARLGDWLRDRARASHRPGPVLVFEPRALGRHEEFLRWQGKPAVAGLVDIALYIYRQRSALRDCGQGIVLRVPGIDSDDEAAYWSDVLDWLERYFDLEAGSISVTAGIDSVNAAFSVDGILRALTKYVTAIQSNYFRVLQSFIRTFHRHPRFVLPERAELSPTSHFLRCWGLNLVQSAHRNGVCALAGSSVAGERDASDNAATRHWLRAQFERLARDGFDGCSVTSRDALDIARPVFDRLVPAKHQLDRLRTDVRISSADLLQIVTGRITEQGMRSSMRTALGGKLALNCNHADPDAFDIGANAGSIALAADQLWQWVWLETGILDDGRIIDAAFFADVLATVSAEPGTPPETASQAAEHLSRYVLDEDGPGEFLVPAA